MFGTVAMYEMSNWVVDGDRDGAVGRFSRICLCVFDNKLACSWCASICRGPHFGRSFTSGLDCIEWPAERKWTLDGHGQRTDRTAGTEVEPERRTSA